MSPLTYKMQRKAFEFSLIQAINWTVMPKEPKKWKTLRRQTSIAPVREYACPFTSFWLVMASESAALVIYLNKHYFTVFFFDRIQIFWWINSLKHLYVC